MSAALLLGAALVARADECSVAIDIGHSLAYPGAMSARGRVEFAFNLDLARDVERAFQAGGCRTTLIGADGDITDLRERARRANGSHLLLSIHHDSNDERFLERWTVDGAEQRYSDRFAGFSLFVSHRNADVTTSLRCAAQIGAALRGTGMQPSRYHADPAFGEPRPYADGMNGVHWFDDLVVLKTATQPAVLIEAGVIINRDEEPWLQRPDVRQRIAAAVVQGARTCLAVRP